MAEVQRNLNLLATQVAEANQRLVSSKGQGGPNFINNANKASVNYTGGGENLRGAGAG